MKKHINTISAFQFFQLVRYSTLILIGVVFAKATATQAEIGAYETFVFIAGLVTFFWLNGLLQAFLPLSKTTAEGKTHIFSAFVLVQLFSLLAALFLFVCLPLLSGVLSTETLNTPISLLLIFIIVGAPASLVEYYYLIRNKNNAIVVYALLCFSAQFILVVAPVTLGYGMLLAVKGLVLSVILRYIWLWVIFLRYNEIHFSRIFLRKHLRHGVPLITAALLSGSAQFIDGLIVTSKFNEEVFAVFRYGARELPLAMLLANALSNAMLPAFTDRNKQQESLQRLKGGISKLMHLLFPLTGILLLVSKPIFPLVFNADFQRSATVFNVYLLLVISRLLMPQTILNGLKVLKPILAASFFELLLNVTLSLLFVQFWGISGIAFATVIAFLFEKVYLITVVQKRLNIRVAEYLPIKNYLLYSFGTIVIFILAELIF